MQSLQRGALSAVALLHGACASGGQPASPPPRADHEHHPGALVHRFEKADEWAKVFDDPSRDAWQKPSEIIDAMRIAPGMVAADVGAGTGYFEPYLSRAVGPSGHVFAVDIEPDMVRYLRQRAEKEHLDNVEAVLSTTTDPSLPAGRIDRVLIVDTWHHIPERSAFAAKVAAALKPEGTITIVEFTMDATHGPPKHHRIALPQLIDELRSAGLDAEGVPVSLPEQYVVIGRAKPR
jgi:SAM-dependent methyltransferase